MAYVDGTRIEAPGSLEETYEACRDVGGVAWIGLYKPSENECARVAAECDLHEWAIAVARRAQDDEEGVAKSFEREALVGDNGKLDCLRAVELARWHVFAGPEFMATVRHGETAPLSA